MARIPKTNRRNLTWIQRLQLDSLLKAGNDKKTIANTLGVCLQTIYNELKRGQCKQAISVYDYYGDKTIKYIYAYSPETAQSNYEFNQTSKGLPLKIGNDYDFVEYVEKRVIKDKLSPCAVLGEINKFGLFNTRISKSTMYRYVSIGIFPNITMEYLPIGQKKKHYRKSKASKAPRGTSIEQRPLEIAERNTFGHWEMDCVVGSTLETLLVLTERLTRYEIIRKIPNKEANSVISCLNLLEKEYGKMFRKLFKTITIDNGVEFSDFDGLQRSRYNKNSKRTRVFYCHPYCSCERGTNERLNREIRRIFPKKTSFKDKTPADIHNAETWINSYPRGIFGFSTSAEMFNIEFDKLKSSIDERYKRRKSKEIA